MLPLERIRDNTSRLHFLTPRTWLVWIQIRIAFRLVSCLSCLSQKVVDCMMSLRVLSTFCCLHSVQAFLLRLDGGVLHWPIPYQCRPKAAGWSGIAYCLTGGFIFLKRCNTQHRTSRRRSKAYSRWSVRRMFVRA